CESPCAGRSGSRPWLPPSRNICGAAPRAFSLRGAPRPPSALDARECHVVHAAVAHAEAGDAAVRAALEDERATAQREGVLERRIQHAVRQLAVAEAEPPVHHLEAVLRPQLIAVVA